MKEPSMAAHDVDGGGAKTYQTPDQPSATRQGGLRTGWHAPDHLDLPAPTYWPAVTALAIVFLAWGIVTFWLISVVGLLLLIVGLAGWIGDLQHGH